MSTPIKVTLPVTATVSARLDASGLLPDTDGKLRISLGKSLSQNVWTVWGTDDPAVMLGDVPAARGVYDCGTLGPSGSALPAGAACLDMPGFTYYFFQLPTVADAIATEAVVTGAADAGNGGGGGSTSAALAIANLAAGGVLGTPAATVDSFLAVNLTQTTAGQTVWPPDPTDTTADHFLEFGNVGAVAVTLATSSAATKSRMVQPNDQVRMTWQGAGEGWALSGCFADGGNSTGAARTIGCKDAFALQFITSNALVMSCSAAGDITGGITGGSGATFNRQRAGSGGVILDSIRGVSVGSGNSVAAVGLALDVQSTVGALNAPNMTGAQFNALATNLPPHLAIASITDQDTTGQVCVNVGTPAAPARAVMGVQHGSVTLAAGTTALIPAHISATSSITYGIKTPVPGAGNLTANFAALGSDRVVGESGTGGGFKLTALIAAGTINVLDLSTLDWQIAG